MQGKSVAILGAGISGLTYALRASTIPQVKFKIFEKSQRPGGRIFSPNVSSNLDADIGANLIDFQDEKQQQNVRSFLKQHNLDKLSPFKQPFLIWDNGLQQGNHNKQRYFYSGGFERLVQGITNKLPKECFVFNHQVSKIQRNQHQWELFDNNNQQYPETFSHLVVALTGSAALQLFKASNIEETKGIQELLSDSPYTRQISAGFRANEHPPFSHILFKNHPVTFMSSHDEKYPQSKEKIIVIQMNEQFSKTHHDLSKEETGKEIIKELPKQMRNWVGQCVKLKKWKSSLLRNKTHRDLKAFQVDSLNLTMVGDVCKGSSRVAGAIETSLGKL